MEIRNETELTYQQLSKIALYNKNYRKSIVIILFFLILFSIINVVSYINTGEVQPGLMIFIVFAIIYLIRFPFIIKAHFKSAMGDSANHCSYIFRDDEMESTLSNGKTQNAHATYRYDIMERLEIRKEYIVLFLSKAEFFPIDKKSFSSEEEMNEVITLLKTKIKNK